MNPERPLNPREELELKITALLLGELNEAEAASVRAAIVKDAKLQQLHDDLKQTIHLVREATASTGEPEVELTESLKLSEERRKTLRAAFVIPALKPEHHKKKWHFKMTLIEVLVVVAIIGILSSMLLPSLSKAKHKAKSIAVISNTRQLDLAKQMWADDKGKSADAEPTMEDLKPYLESRGVLRPVAGERYVLGKVGEPVVAQVATEDAKRTLGRLPKEKDGDFDDSTVVLSSDGSVSYANRAPIQTSSQLARNETFDVATSDRSYFSVDYQKASKSAGSSAEELARRLQNAPPPPPTASPQVQIALPDMTASDGVDAPATVPAGGTSYGLGQPSDEVPKSEWEPQTTIPLNYASAKNVGAALESLYGEHDKVKVDAINNAITLSGNDRQGAELIAQLDTPTKQTLIEARLLEREKTSGERKLSESESQSTPNWARYGGAIKADESKGLASLGDGVEVYQGMSMDLSSVAPNDDMLGENVRGQIRGSDLRQKLQSEVSGKDVSSHHFSDTYAFAMSDDQGAGLKGMNGRPEGGAQWYEDFSNRDLPSNLPAQAGIKDDAQKWNWGLDSLTGGSGTADAAKLGALFESGGMGGAAPTSPRFRESSSGTADLYAGRAFAGGTTESFGAYTLHGQTEGSGAPAEQSAPAWLGLLKQQQSEPTEQDAFYLGAAADGNIVLPDSQTKDKAPAQASDLLVTSGLHESPPITAGYAGTTILGGKGLSNQAELQMALNKTPEIKAQTKARLNSAPKVELDTPLPRKPSTNAPIPQPEVLTRKNNFSTFSLNVSDVSFKLAAASLGQGKLPDAASIRSEEFINAFDYRDPEAPTGSPIAFAWERARYPFAHNRDLLRFSIKTSAAGRQAGSPLNIVLLLDNSGSMERADRVQIIREALNVLASQLQAQDKLSVITFARTPRLVADGISGVEAGKVTDEVAGLTPQGGTNLEDAMNLAYRTALRHYLANGINRVVVMTDGAANLGDVEPGSLKQQVETNRKQGIALDCFGIGWEGFNDDLLEVLARNGDGRYGFINSPEEAATDFAGQLAGALKVAASDVKVQVEFNPTRVTSYRQIGYAKHQLTKEQFRDNTVDAAEIAAQEAGNALYTVEVNPAGTGPLGTVRVRYKVPGTTDYRELAWDVPFTGNAVALEQASPAMRLAATASALSEWLALSPYAGEIKPDDLLNYLNGVPEVFGADPRPKKLEWMIRQARSIAGD